MNGVKKCDHTINRTGEYMPGKIAKSVKKVRAAREEGFDMI